MLYCCCTGRFHRLDRKQPDGMEGFIKMVVFGIGGILLLLSPTVLLLLEFQPKLFRGIRQDYIEINLFLSILANASFFCDWVLVMLAAIVSFIHCRSIEFWLFKIR